MQATYAAVEPQRMTGDRPVNVVWAPVTSESAILRVSDVMICRTLRLLVPQKGGDYAKSWLHTEVAILTADPLHPTATGVGTVNLLSTACGAFQV